MKGGGESRPELRAGFNYTGYSFFTLYFQSKRQIERYTERYDDPPV